MAGRRTRRRFTAEFKAQAVKRVLKNSKLPAEVATELGVSAIPTVQVQAEAKAELRREGWRHSRRRGVRCGGLGRLVWDGQALRLLAGSPPQCGGCSTPQAAQIR